VKKDVREPLVFAGVFAGLMAFRYELLAGKKRAAPRLPRETPRVRAP
jgi:hypothetical protein